MRLRTILNCTSAFATIAGLGIPAARAQESAGKRLAGVVAVAVSEYRLGMDNDGRVIAQLEVDEARAFLAEAQEGARRLTGENAARVQLLVDSLAAAVNAGRSRREVDALNDRFTEAMGDDAALELPSRHVDVAAGRALYQLHCASCHGNSGFGDGLAAPGLDPPPAALAGDSARDLASGLMFRVVSVGIKGTAMAAWDSTLSIDQRWDVIAYVNTLRVSAGNSADGDVSPVIRDPDQVHANVRGLLEDALRASREGRPVDATDRAFDAYAAFEPLETLVRPRNAALVAKLEGNFLAFRTALRAGDSAAAAKAHALVIADLPEAVTAAQASGGGWRGFTDSLLIILREGIEAMLIIAAIAATLMRTGNGRRMREVWFGVGLGLVASGATAFVLQSVLRALPATREIIEGVTMLVAVAVLFSVSYWILSKVESDRWRSYVNEKVGAAVAGGSRLALAGVAFLVVYREGAETALFYQALLQASNASVTHIAAGLVTGVVALCLVYFMSNRLTKRLPLRRFFAVTGALLYAMAFSFMGKGLRELQEGGALQSTPISGWPTIDAVGIYPSVETLAGQGVLVALFLFACWYTFARPAVIARRRALAALDPASAEPASTPTRIPQTPAQSSAPS